MMRELHAEYPAYGWDVNKGYGTARTRRRSAPPGPTPYHRVSWQLLWLRLCLAGCTAVARGPAPDGARWNHECRGP